MEQVLQRNLDINEIFLNFIFQILIIFENFKTKFVKFFLIHTNFDFLTKIFLQILFLIQTILFSCAQIWKKKITGDTFSFSYRV